MASEELAEKIKRKKKQKERETVIEQKRKRERPGKTPVVKLTGADAPLQPSPPVPAPPAFRGAGGGTRISDGITNITGRLTYPRGSIVNNPAAQAPSGALGGQFGNDPRRPNNDPYALVGIPGITDNVTDLTNQIVPGSNPSSPSLVGQKDNRSDDSPYANYSGYRTVQSQAEAQALYGTDTTGGAYLSTSVVGNNWKVKTVKDANGNWVKITVPDYGRGRNKSANRDARGVGYQQRQVYQTPAQVQGSFFTQYNSWRLATG